MMGYNVINLRDALKTEYSDKIISFMQGYSCPYNHDVEDFLHNKAQIFSEQRIASVYLVFASYRQEYVLVGYYALAQKYFHADLKAKGRLSSRLRSRLRRFTNIDAELGKAIITSPLIGQLGKNYANGYDKLITGDELLKLACDTVREAQRLLGGRVVYLECEDVPSLVKFYERNGFVNFGNRILDGDEKDVLSGDYLIQMLKYLD